MFVGINMFLVLLKAHFNPRPTTRPEMTLSQALNIFVPAKINSLVYLLSRDVVTSDVQFIATFGLHIAGDEVNWLLLYVVFVLNIGYSS